MFKYGWKTLSANKKRPLFYFHVIGAFTSPLSDNLNMKKPYSYLRILSPVEIIWWIYLDMKYLEMKCHVKQSSIKWVLFHMSLRNWKSRKILISKRTIFKKIAIMHGKKGNLQKIMVVFVISPLKQQINVSFCQNL